MNGSALRQLRTLAALWNKIEGRAKEAEQFRGETITAAINEMRYAGRRIVDVLDIMFAEPQPPDAEDMIAEHLAVAKAYLINADHDLTDAICLFAHKRFLRTTEVYRRSRITKYCPLFDELYPEILEAHEIVRQSRETRQLRIEAYERLETVYIPKIKTLYDELSNSRKLTLPNAEAIARRRLRFVQVFTAVAAVASIVGAVVSILEWIYQWPDFKAIFGF